MYTRFKKTSFEDFDKCYSNIDSIYSSTFSIYFYAINIINAYDFASKRILSILINAISIYYVLATILTADLKKCFSIHINHVF